MQTLTFSSLTMCRSLAIKPHCSEILVWVSLLGLASWNFLCTKAARAPNVGSPHSVYRYLPDEGSTYLTINCMTLWR